MLKLEGLTLNGFKSFSDRTDVLFPDGITCVVGPNGCGKSNILDAIAWVLGEQSPRQLRGSKMEEVIFAGTKSRKPAGMAEVTLRFVPRLRVPEGAEPEDVDPRLTQQLAITRRLYRNGDSEYLINDERSRLKDIVQLIMGTGMGTRVYSIIEQGRVGQILSSKPADRRILIEEAAGITRYKAKRRAAKLKLDESEQSLLRVSDIVGELERQIRSLKRQVGTARRYRRLAGRRRVVIRALAAVKFRGLSDRLDSVEMELQRLNVSAGESQEALEGLEGSTRESQARVAALEARRDAVLQHAHDVELELEGSRHAITSGRQRATDLAGRILAAAEALRSIERDIADQSQGRVDLASRQARLDSELSTTRGDAEAAATGAKDVRERLSHAHRTIAETKESVFEVMSETSGLKNRKAEIESALARMEVQAERLSGSLTETATQLRLVISDLEAGESRLEKAQAEEQRLRASLAEIEGSQAAAGRRTTELRAAREAVLAEVHDAQWQLAAVDETIRTRATHATSVRQFLEKPPAGVLGAVTDFAIVEKGDELAAEKALGRLLQAVVLESREAAERIAKSLSEGQKSEIHFVYPGAGDEVSVPERPADKRVVGSIADSVSFDPHVAWISGVVPHAWLVEVGKDALALSRKAPDQVFVSRDGVFMGPGGTGSAGRPLGEGAGILETRARKERLEGDVAERRGRLEEVDARSVEAEREMAELSAERERLASALASVEKDVVGARHDVAGMRQGASLAESRHATLLLEHEAAASERDDSRRRLADLSLKLAACATGKADLERKLAKTSELATRLEGEVEGADATLSRLREELAVKSERREAARMELDRFQAELERRQIQRDEAAALLETLESERTETQALVERTEAAVATGSDRFSVLRSEMETVEVAVREGRTSMLEGAERLRDLRLEHDRRAKLVGEAEVRRERIAADLEHVLDDCREKLGVEAHELPMPEPPVVVEAPKRRSRKKSAETITDEMVAGEPIAAEESLVAGEEAAEEAGGPVELDGDVEAMEDENGAAVDATFDESLPWIDGQLDVESLEKESESLRKRLERIGPVNLVAIEEYDELEGRHAFLAKERADLVEAIASLRRTIEEIDDMSRDRFNEAFEAIKGTFDQAFQTLFRGGKAELRLQEDEDPLECGIEIIAQPPGKRLQNMMLLSGGEKALTAIALLFALFRYRPSPFCVLDEVDAPLDESNVLRFLDLVEELSKDTQFVLITHVRRSMERAKVLYGVTMQEPGCSKMVSVQFDADTGSASAA